MNTILVGYDLNTPGQDYAELIDWLKQHNWWHCLDSTWLIRTSDSAKGVRDRIRGLVDPNDHVLVLDVTGDHWATHGLAKNCNDWLRDNLS